ncbi:helix-turn-helix transcriptional regulator [Nocardioides sp.]|uniref:helix-turn-helix transcriptional regulator n=1 Tax=Nocardioides sp. TaxID=35761 RepID=UPI002F3F6B0D
MTLSDLQRGRAAYAERRWDACVTALRAVDATDPLDAEDLKLLSLALYLVGDDHGSADALERCHRAALDARRWRDAAETAFWYAFMLFGIGEPARAGGWLARCRELVAEHSLDGTVAAFPSTVEARGLLEAGRDEEALALAAAAADIGRTHGDANLEVLGRLTVGQVLLQEGRREEALGCLDEVMLTVSTGDLYPTVAGLAYCAVIGICMGLLDVPRAQEWTSVLSDWCDAQTGLVPYRGSCLVHRSQIKTMRGDWAGALEEARRACDVPGAAAGDAWYQLGEIHRMHGAYAEAEDAYRQANSLGRQPEPGLALMRLAQGRVDEALTTFRRLHAEPDRLDRADVLSGYVETMLATGEVDAAEAAVDELESGSEHLPLMYRARAAEARAAVLLARDDGAGGLACLRPAWKAWHALGMPYDEARVRVRMGDACRLLGDDSSAALEYDAAREAFHRLGARPDLERLDRAADPPAGGLTGREVEVLRLVAAGSTNREIAQVLVLSEKTVARHLSNIYTKLGIGSRAAATAYAYDHRLV